MDDGHGFDLSFSQARLWVIDRLAPGEPLYNLRCAVRLRQAVDAAALQSAVNAVVERHEALRTVFREHDGRPVQIVLPAMTVPLVGADLRRVPSERREEVAVRLAAEFGDRPFALDEGPLLRAMLVWLGPADYALVIGMHHIVADGWSMGVLARELGALYEGFATGRPARLEPLPVQYADFAAWQRRHLSGERLGSQVAYWRAALEGLSPLELPLDHPRPAVQAHRGAALALELPGPLVAGLGRLARAAGATLFMALLAGVGATLGRWCGQSDVVVGAPIAGRTRPELEGLIGFFVNTLVLRVDLSGDPGFAELVGRVRERALDAYAHADLPFEKLVEELAPRRDLSRNPLFQVTFQLFESPSAPDAVGAKAGLEVPVTSSLFDLRIDMWPAPGGALAGRIEFDTDLFERSSVRWLAERLRWLLEQAVADPGRPLGTLSACPPAQQRLIDRANASAAPLPAGCAHEHVQAQAARAPEAPAVVDEGGAWSYGELNAHANALAGVLAGAGAGPGTVVALCLERGRAFVAGALAAMKAGAAYLPLDRAYPDERLAAVLADAAPAALLVAGADGAPAAPAGCRVIDLERWPAGPAEDPPAAAGPHDPAYLIYTSGSTGAPKGVVVEHRGLMNLVGWHLGAYAVGPGVRGAQIASAGFDAAVWEIWPYLCAGGAVHVCPEAARAEPEALAAWLAEQEIEVAFVPTPLAELLMDEPWPAGARLRVMLTGGDRLRRFANPAHPYELVNHYGPTESSVVTSAGPVGAESRPGRLPGIGRPIANVVCRVCDPAGAPLGPGCPGELWIGGAGLARGYHADPALTAARFVTDAAGERWYRSGDRVRWQADGTLAFLGRTDDQVKIRGHRIEPREVEAALVAHPAVARAVVVGRPHPEGGPLRLAAYVTLDEGGTAEEPGSHVEHWRRLYEETYRDGDPADPAFDIRGWNSSEDGAPLGEEVMREQVDQTVARIRALAPRRVLEIGCGTGLLLFRLAAGCERYVATDFSGAALARVGDEVRRRGWGHVDLLERTADEGDGLDGEGYDVVVLNSVVQYFPDEAYLGRVVERALERLRPGGSVFVGDVRNHALVEEFHAWAALAGAPADLPAEELRRRARRAVEAERELLVDPAWFTRFASGRAPPPRVRAWPRRGRRHTELTRFRYDVTLTPAVPATGAAADVTWLDWESDGLDVERLAQLVAAAERPLGVRGIPSARLRPVAAARAALEDAPPGLTAGALRDALPRDGGVDPEDLWALSGRLEVEVGWHGRGETGRYDLLVTPAGAARPDPVPPVAPAGIALCNDPLRRTAGRVAEIREWLRRRLPEAMVPSAIVVLDELPVTAHGKVDLAALPPPEGAAAPSDDEAPPRTDVERRLAAVWAQVLDLPSVGVDDNFFSLGGDSILSIKLAARAAEDGMHFSAGQLFQNQTVAELARVVSSRPRIDAEQDPIVGPVPLTPIQRWFLDQDLAEAHHFNQAALLPVPATVRLDLLARALRAVVAHHDALHLRVTRGPDGWRQRSDPPARTLPVASVDLSALAPADRPDALERAAGRLQASLGLEGPLVRVGIVTLGPGQPRRLLVAIHHLAVDGVSWGILVEDLWRAYGRLADGEPVALPRKTTSFRQWAERLAEAAAGPAVGAQEDLWLEQLPEAAPRLPRDLPGTDNTVAVTRRVRAELTRGETEALLRRLPAERRTRVDDVLLSALARALARWTGDRRVAIAVEGHGREPLFEDVDLSRTVGWFTSIFPVLLEIPAEDDPVAALLATAERLARLPDRGVGFGMLRHLSPDDAARARLAARPWPEVSFNYLGRLDDGPADPLRERTGPQRSPAGARPHLLEVNGAVTEGVLRFDVHYACRIHREQTIRALAEGFMDGVRALLAAPAPGDGSGVSARDLEILRARLARDEEGAA